MPSADLPAVPSVPGALVPLLPEQEAEILALDASAFVFAPDPGCSLDFFEWDRSFGVRADDGELVGLNTAFSLTLSLPAGPLATTTTGVPMAGLSWVAVHPGYRRRGVLSAMVRHHLHEVHARGAEPLSGLHASEPAIYGRFGYGLATVGYHVKLGRRAELRDGAAAADDVAIRFHTADATKHADLVADLYTRACAARPGMVDRPRALTLEGMRQTARELEKDEPVRLLVAERNGEPTGYALVLRNMKWEQFAPAGSTQVHELAAVDEASRRRLWQTVTDFDLTTSTEAWRVATDDPLLSWLVDPRAIQPRLTDELWVRVVDLDRALTARGYAAPVDVVLEVSDALCPWNEGRWRLHADASGDPAAVRCESTSDPSDLALDVRELGSVLVGGLTLSSLWRAGLVAERTPGAVERLSVALRAAVEPATTYGF